MYILSKYGGKCPQPPAPNSLSPCHSEHPSFSAIKICPVQFLGAIRRHSIPRLTSGQLITGAQESPQSNQQTSYHDLLFKMCNFPRQTLPAFTRITIQIFAYWWRRHFRTNFGAMKEMDFFEVFLDDCVF